MRDKNPLDMALRLLTYRERSIKELKDRLTSKGFTKGEVEGTVEYLIEAGYLDDRRYALRIATSVMENRGWGVKRIIHELRAKGIPGDIIQDVVSGIDRKEELRSAKGAVEKWLRTRGISLPLDEGDIARAWRFLNSRGFSVSVIREVMKDITEREGVSLQDEFV